MLYVHIHRSDVTEVLVLFQGNELMLEVIKEFMTKQ